MISSESLLDLNIARYSALILTEKEPQMLEALRDALDRDLERKKQLHEGPGQEASREHE